MFPIYNILFLANKVQIVREIYVDRIKIPCFVTLHVGAATRILIIKQVNRVDIMET